MAFNKNSRNHINTRTLKQLLKNPQNHTKMRHISNRLFTIVLMSYNVDFKTLRLCFVDCKTIVYNEYVFPGGRELRDRIVLGA